FLAVEAHAMHGRVDIAATDGRDVLDSHGAATGAKRRDGELFHAAEASGQAEWHSIRVSLDDASGRDGVLLRELVGNLQRVESHSRQSSLVEFEVDSLVLDSEKLCLLNPVDAQQLLAR